MTPQQEAERIVTTAYKKYESGRFNESPVSALDNMVAEVATALLAAESRGRGEEREQLVSIAERFQCSKYWWESWAEEHTDEGGDCMECGVPYRECVYQAAYEMMNTLAALRRGGGDA